MNRQEYNKIGSVYCKALKQNVIFNRHGWKHATRHGNGERRNSKDAKLRLSLLKYAVDIVKTASSIEETKLIEVKNSASEVVPTSFYKLTQFAAKGTKCISVIVRQFPDGMPHYYSIFHRVKKRKK